MSRARRLTRGGFALLLSLLLAAPFASSAQEALPPEAEQAMRGGLAAAKQQEWQLAIKYFGEAREEAPYAPEVLFNLALAHDNAGGRELVAIAWFRAFLAAAPEAANAGRVRERIFELEVKVEANAAKLIAKAKEATARLPDEYDRNKALEDIAEDQARTGDVTGAMATAAGMPDEYRASAYEGIARAQAEAGDIAGAMATAARISDKSYKIFAYGGIAEAQAKAGDIAGAKATAARFSGESYTTFAYREIAKAQAKAGDIAGTLETAARISDDNLKPESYAIIAEAQLLAGDIAGAKELAARIPDGYWRSKAYLAIATTLAKAGRIADAETAAARITDDHWRSTAYRVIATAQARAGDIAAGGETADEKEIAGEPYVRDEEIDAWTAMVEHQLGKPLFQDLQGFIRSLTDKEPRKMVDALANAAADLAEAMRMLQQKDAEWRQRRADAQ